MVRLISKHDANRSEIERISKYCTHHCREAQPRACSAEYIQTKPRARNSNHKTAHVADVTHCLGANERQQHVVCLLPLELVDSLYGFRRANQRVPRTLCGNHVFDESFLSVVRREDDDLVSSIPEQAHVHVCGHNVLCFAQILKEIRARLLLPLSHKVFYVHKLRSLQRYPVTKSEINGTKDAARTLANPAFATWNNGDDSTCGMSSKPSYRQL